MRSFIIAVYAVLLTTTISVTTASAHAMCDGDFEFVQGSWVATRACQERVAERIAQRMHRHISEHPSGPYEWSPEEFCRGNPDIEVSTFCAPYQD